MRQFGVSVSALAKAALYKESQTAEGKTEEYKTCKAGVSTKTRDAASRDSIETEAEKKRLLWEHW